VHKGSPFLFACFILLTVLLGLDEYYRMALPQRRLEGVAGAVAGTFLAASFLTSACGTDRLLSLLTLTVVLSALLFLFRIRDIRDTAREFALFAAGFLYVPLLLVHLLLLRYAPHGSEWVFLLMVVVMAGDTGAYYVGSSFGKHKLYPVVSPNKSVEGACGGLAGSILGAFIARATFFPELAPVDCLVTALLLGVLGQLGDLFESLLKRGFGVKDSGSIIPGHGGILDRLDSILFAAPAAYYYAVFIFMHR
jgi:phosphatidate cytidylyltransferase